MKPETHLLAGLALGSAVGYPEPLWLHGAVIVATICGSVAPDVPIAVSVKVDDWKKRERFSTEHEGGLWFMLKEISHSPVFILIGLAVAFFAPIPYVASLLVLTFTIGLMSHWWIDALTHCGAEFKATDQSLLWPAYCFVPGRAQPGQIPKLGYWMGQNAQGWEYRLNYKIGEGFGTKRPERITQVVMLLIAVVLIGIKYWFPFAHWLRTV